MDDHPVAAPGAPPRPAPDRDRAGAGGVGAAAAIPGLVLVTPQGWRIEGLDLDTLLRVLARRA